MRRDRDALYSLWRDFERSKVENSGTVTFVPAPADQGTEVHIELRYDVPGGAGGALIAKRFGEEPAMQVKDDLRRFKQIVETGEVVRSDGAPRGPAQPPPAQAAPGPSGRRRPRRRREGGRVMRAAVWSGRITVQVENVPDPRILNGRDAIVKISSTAICGSDLHL
ncbi:MAG: hypothetical protein ACRDLN_13100 [Solirubrobacteraceae bacterium]